MGTSCRSRSAPQRRRPNSLRQMIALMNAPNLSPAPAWAWVPGVVVGACALAFTILAFWWLNARQGKLRSYAPHSFAAAVQDTTLLLLRFPLVLFNAGAKPIIVQDLRLVFPKKPQSVLALPWRRSSQQLKPASEDVGVLPAVFAVSGRAAREAFIEFGGPFPGFKLEAKDYPVRIEAVLGHKKGWQAILDFTLRAGHIAFPEQFLAYSNSPGDLTEEDRAKAAVALASLMSRLSQRPEG